MKKGRSNLLTDNLDLLLDTICNTFGAVIFIATLVAILVGKSAFVPAKASDVSVVDEIIHTQHQRIVTAKTRLHQLEIQHQQQQKIIDLLASNQSKELASQISLAAQELTTLSGQHVSILENVSNIQSETLKMEEQIHRQAIELSDLSEQNRKLKAELAESTELASRTARIPQVRSTSKQGVVFMLHKTRLFRVISPDGLIDDVDCILSDLQGRDTIRPRPGGGISISQENDPGVSKKFEGLKKSEHFVRLFVSRDSFAQFQPLKNMMIRLGYEYEIILFTEDNAELYLSPSPVKSFVQ